MAHSPLPPTPSRKGRGSSGRTALSPPQRIARGRHRAAVAARAVHHHRQPHRRYRTGAPAVGACVAAAVVGQPVRHRPAGPRPARRHGRRHAADAEDRLHRRHPWRRRRHRAGLRRRLLSRHDRHRDPRHRRHRPDRARPSGADHHRRVGARRPDRQPDGDRRRLARLAQSDTHHPRPGAHVARTRLCRGGTAQRHDRPGDHPARDDAEPAALSRRHPGQRGIRRDPCLDRSGSARPRSAGIADARHDAVLDQLQRRHPQRLVVVVGRADRHHRDGVPRPVLPHRRSRRNRQSHACDNRHERPRAARREIARRLRPSSRLGARGGRCVVQPAPGRALRPGR